MTENQLVPLLQFNNSVSILVLSFNIPAPLTPPTPHPYPQSNRFFQSYSPLKYTFKV